MCGIAGFVRLDRKPADPAMIKKMTDAMAHRGPNADGFFVKDQVALGHRRLSIIDLSETANQPFVDASGNFKLVFNGELYNFQDVKRAMYDHPFRTSSDTEVLAEAYAKKGIDCISDFKGMFAFAIWDEAKQELCIARDRMGVKPLYYYQDDNVFLFASEIRAILASGVVARKLNEAALTDFFSYQSVSSPISIIKNIQQLEAGQYIKIRNGSIDVRPFWDIASGKKEFDFSSRKAITSRIRELLLTAVEGRLISDVPFGAFLSGGIDSSAVVGLMAAVSQAPVNTFNVSLSEEGFDESGYAELVAKKFNTRHEKIELKPTVMLDELENALNAMDTPSGDGINTYVVSKAVKKAGLTVALSGIGGDELFAGYPFFQRFTKLNQSSVIWNNSYLLRRLASRAVSLSGSASNARLGQLLDTSSTRIEDMYPVFRKIISTKKLRSMTTTGVAGITELEKKYTARATAMSQYPLLSQVSIAEFIGYTQQTLLKDTDQMSMAVSLEVREPFFDHELVEYVLNIPDAIKYPNYPKQLLVESLGDLLPPEIVHRRKQGFAFPWSLWMKNELRSFCEPYLHSISDRGFIKGKELLSYWGRFLKGDPGVRWMEIWLFVILERWLQRNEIQ